MCDLLTDAIDFDACGVCGAMAGRFPCYTCGDDGVVEYDDTPELWGEDCPSETNHLAICPECDGKGGDWWCSKCEKAVSIGEEVGCDA